jgi:hypothetical protein
MDIKELRKFFDLCHLPTVAVKESLGKIDASSYIIREEENYIVTYQKHRNNVSYPCQATPSL